MNGPVTYPDRRDHTWLSFSSVSTVLRSVSVGKHFRFGSRKPPRHAPQDSCSEKRDEWVRVILEKMESIKPSITREDLTKVFRTEGALDWLALYFREPRVPILPRRR
jgi:hypothetical protein